MASFNVEFKLISWNLFWEIDMPEIFILQKLLFYVLSLDYRNIQCMHAKAISFSKKIQFYIHYSVKEKKPFLGWRRKQ